MEKGQKVFVGLSGGVDSAVSAALLQKEGYEVTGVFIKIQIEGYPCPAAEDRISAQRVAAHLRIPFIEIDLSKEYEKEVLAQSLSEWSRGRTPNPDTLCNEKIKFGAFFRFARAQGAEYVATGHYAQVKDGLLYKGADDEKDQSYFLWMVSQETLRHTLFPVGHLKKPRVRELAQTFGLPNAARKDSQGLCFLGDLSVEKLLSQTLSVEPGELLNEEGSVIGTHRGAALYTLGQRHGFTLNADTPETQPHFVIAKDIVRNTVTVSTSRMPRGEITEVMLAHMNWIGEVKDTVYSVRFRYRGKLIPAKFERSKGIITLSEPHYVPEGQSLVLYEGERCIGGGIVDKVALR